MPPEPSAFFANCLSRFASTLLRNDVCQSFSCPQRSAPAPLVLNLHNLQPLFQLGVRHLLQEAVRRRLNRQPTYSVADGELESVEASLSTVENLCGLTRCTLESSDLANDLLLALGPAGYAVQHLDFQRFFSAMCIAAALHLVLLFPLPFGQVNLLLPPPLPFQQRQATDVWLGPRPEAL